MSLENTAPWPEKALTLLDSLWALDTHMAVIRRRLQSYLDHYPSAAEIRAMANRYREGNPPAPVARVARGPQPSAPIDHSVYAQPGPAKPPDNPIRRVQPGTHSTRGFSMLGGKLHG